MFALVASGGIIGTAARIAIEDSMHKGQFPTATFMINIFGAFILGVVVTISGRYEPSREPMIRAFAGTGICGGFTTFSTACLESFNLIRTGDVLLGIGYILMTITIGLAAVYAGTVLVGSLLSKREAD
ncbi:MAG: CrcB family protein [Acidimicrobiaceae bacterium]|nr:CrcB family protein [Acidimicrobiaceae bacterium]